MQINQAQCRIRLRSSRSNVSCTRSLLNWGRGKAITEEPMNNKTWLISFRMCSIFQHSPNYSSCPWLVLATYSSANTRACWTVSSLVALTVSYMFNIWTRLIYLYFRSSSWTTVTSWLTHEFFVPDDEIYIWLEARYLVLMISFAPSFPQHQPSVLHLPSSLSDLVLDEKACGQPQRR